MSFTWKMEA